jgi:hypothetical protein
MKIVLFLTANKRIFVEKGVLKVCRISNNNFSNYIKKSFC